MTHVAPFYYRVRLEEVGLVDSVYNAAITSLRTCSHTAGLKASGRRAGHRQVWARDTMIALLGGALVEDETIRQALANSLSLLRSKQTRSGLMPNNVDAETLRPNFRAYADGGLWWIIGSSIVAPDLCTTERILAWYECQDVDQSGLISMQESTDWQDLFCTRGKGLYLNAMYILALEAAARLARDSRPDLASQWSDRAETVRERINEFFWYCGDAEMIRHIRHTFSTESVEDQDSLGRKRWLPVKRILVNERYYLSYLGFRAAGEWFDSLAHLLLILAGVPDGYQIGCILTFIQRHRVASPPMRAMFPAVQPGDPDWRPYYGMLNSPGQYHNGGLWPFIGGFWVAVLVKLELYSDARAALEELAELNSQGEFNEWHDGETSEPKGVHDQAWSSGMYIYAYECVRQRRALWFE